ncbi:helix-turn-helix transcriptional regulator [Sinorhizobium meliloti]|uniref:helix-turn-helix transcriptional regulator n=1 Tax=Rhizobium meliloti TaxID=382 RepID=UPI000FDA4441|nr:AlpA family phage regulatory protein [Sinorhizobium meliloti]RVH97619.1 AlpA family phage regulatory protein [Sinorhizobium meliloti]RVK82302.1 AlpA family phage regulatory protein [Sinorhizobium meliloti]RVL18191.1 AlpA family phage regulatory protein [Sinorhizobium meliloti]RVP39443.1 AlpA family phage regulatory protein [Sinorhizobium meliloti]
MTPTVPELIRNIEQADEKFDFPATGYVRLKQILGPRGPLPISRSGFWAGVKGGKFPKPRKISERVTVWRAEDIHALLAKIERGEA